MLSALGRTADGRPVYGATLRGVGILAAGLGAILAFAVIAVIALGHANRALSSSEESTERRILTACMEGNARHAEALPQIAALIAGTPPKDPDERAAQGEAVEAILSGTKPSTAAGAIALHGLKDFAQIIAPAYNCAERVRRLTAP